MPDFDLRFIEVRQHLDDETALSKCLFFPQVSGYWKEDRSDKSRHADLLHQIKPLLEDEAGSNWFRHRAPAETPTVREIEIAVEPARGDKLWLSPITLQFFVVIWKRADQIVCSVPAVGLTTLCDDDERIDEHLRHEIDFAIRRRKLKRSLRNLVQVSRVERTEIHEFERKLSIPTPKQIVQREGEPTEQSVLEQVAERMSVKPGKQTVWCREEQVEQLAERLRGRSARSVLLVGPSSVGKTAVVRELVRRRAELGHKLTSFWHSSGARLVAGASGFGMWQERCEKLCKEADENTMIHFGSLFELMEVGRGGSSTQGIAEFLRPHLDRGELTIIVECTPEQKTALEREAPSLLQSLSEVRVEEPSAEALRAILENECTRLAPVRRHPGISADGLAKLDRLHKRYATYSVAPGRPLRFLRHLLLETRAKEPLGATEITRAFSEETGLPLTLIDESVPLDLTELQAWFSSRVIGQPEAIELVTQLLSAVKSMLTAPGKPIASLLFIGPTGVGKTELAKTIAEFFYRDRQRMIRIDMSEYADPLAADRLLGGAGREGVLTSQVRDQPFGVVLLDEFEKAHPLVFDLLLQVLGEGRLTDAAGNLADFRNSIVIMTSNLGVESSTRRGMGLVDASLDAARLREHFESEVRDFVRPELFNRIDRVVTFNPLDETALRAITQRELSLSEQRDGLRFRDIEWSLGDGVVDVLIELGSDPRYGARPLKRAIEEHLLRPLADAANGYAHATPLNGRAATAERDGRSRIRVEVKARAMEKGDARVAGASGNVVRAAEQVAKLRRLFFRLDVSAITQETRNDAYRLQQHAEKLRKRQLVLSPEDLKELARYETYLRQLEGGCDFARQGEESILIPFHSNKTEDEFPADYRQTLRKLEAAWESMLLSAFKLTLPPNEPQDAVTIAVYGAQKRWLIDVVDGYVTLAKERRFECEMAILFGATRRKDVPKGTPPEQRYVRLPPERQYVGLTGDQPRTVLVRETITQWDREQILAGGKKTESAVGVLMRITGDLVLPLFEPERGIHSQISGRTVSCAVDTSRKPFQSYPPPPGIIYRIADLKSADPSDVRRAYSDSPGKAHDALLTEWRSLSRRAQEVIPPAVWGHLMQRCRDLVD